MRPLILVEPNMKALGVVVLGAGLVAFAGIGRAQDDNAKKIVGIWETTKASGDLPAGTLIEFTSGKEKDLKLIVSIKDSTGVTKLEGTYTIAKDKLPVKVSIGGETIEETFTIKRLSDEALELEDKDKKVTAFKKKK
jgi:uncharacterized protein (TIGR03066 family)